MNDRASSKEKRFAAHSGWPVFFALLVLLALTITYPIRFGIESGLDAVPFIAAILALVILPIGFFIVNPNMAKVLILFGRYRGSVRGEGFYWTNPFTVRRTVSLRAQNVASEKIKVNDLAGNPIEIGAVIVWQVRDTAQATFDVEDYLRFVDLQVETALRHMARSHPYDDRHADDLSEGELNVPSLRGGVDEIVLELQEELQRRLDIAGIAILEARISHLAYAPEIASAMLQRQQASAIIAARQKIVQGAVSMVKDALVQLGREQVVELDAERRATLVGNLLVVLCGHHEPTPVLNTGSLYN
jgi:regulator of protease activity HflC (stomatin/prohibitin superfamily)